MPASKEPASPVQSGFLLPNWATGPKPVLGKSQAQATGNWTKINQSKSVLDQLQPVATGLFAPIPWESCFVVVTQNSGDMPILNLYVINRECGCTPVATDIFGCLKCRNYNWTGHQLIATATAVQLHDQSSPVQLPVANWTFKHYALSPRWKKYHF
ncbi:hypothetical protein L210DRAFT_3509837 [Boletus edulis BED1]|uniref:Uncharacterized protein n=1 Tax=Boletus edulis BED1 TaxID=1328754 RepID=A0AAD4BEK5_BOLED|nr:hypothetical protein L210DRAFT_3509837 [Boletus edulis BED1]